MISLNQFDTEKIYFCEQLQQRIKYELNKLKNMYQYYSITSEASLRVKFQQINAIRCSFWTKNTNKPKKKVL